MAALTGKVAIITGGSNGIGKATALRLAHDGAKVVIQYRSNEQSAQEVVSQIGEQNALAVKGNASLEKFGQIDIVIANAGSLPLHDLANTSEQDFNDSIDLNVKGPYFLVQIADNPLQKIQKKVFAADAVPHFRPGGRIILVSTTLCHASTVTPPYLLYLTTKGAIEQMVRVLAKELGPKEITINAVARPEPVLNAMKNLSPRGHLAQPEEIAEAMGFFSSPASGWVSGQVLRVNGGMA
ncbi:NAD(P)-binding protein [Penicillium psychrosexuale]|uniref:NAD(P)-binding protein n=1 Tax=Penicillium psychrosexuale TaxID=1002107 RepID=UPI0025459DE3|nr:NAD(P)-binding protein [Penicillium psychrosexuale]KAJ5799389.1 NAD(P)-binding protein [Penicillium psychrosexuale]